jgi:nitric-oxide synthase
MMCRALGGEYEKKLTARLCQVQQDIEARAQYELTYEELVFGARTAWRNAPRCVNRIVWRQLEVQTKE